MTLRLLLAAALAAIAALALPDADAEAARKAKLTRFQSCDGLVRYARRHAIRHADALIVPRGGIAPGLGGGEDDSGGGGGQPPPQAQAPAREDGGAEDFSGSNVQEEGVDEPDIVKTDGAHAFAVAGNHLHAIDLRSGRAALADTMDLGGEYYDHSLLLHGARLLVLSQRSGFAAVGERIGAFPSQSTTRLTELDVSAPGRLRVLRTLEVEGGLLTARLTGPTARLVLTTTPRALVSRARVRRSRAASWLPRARVTSRVTGNRRTRRLVACRSVRRTASFSGAEVLTVLTVDMERGLPAVDADSVLTDADTVYGSPGSLYVATHRWLDPERAGAPSINTAIHRFDAAQRGVTSYRATGTVDGYLLSQWALSEHDGHLRVASTSEPSWVDPRGESESHVTVLREAGGRLAPVGRVSGLGRGERIYAVRFIGTTGYVVTFRETDPLYTLDVTDPTAPKVLGELKIRGFSSYLHPVGPGLLLGVGQDATATGATLGTQLSLFDVSDPRTPRRLHQITLAGGSSSEVEYDHLAFLYWPPTGLAMIPVVSYDEGPDAFTGAVGFKVDQAAGITELGRVSHRAPELWRSQVRRSVVVGGRVLTFSESGMMAVPIDTLRGGTWLPFPP